MLMETLEEHRMSHHVLSDVLEKQDLPVQERRFVNRLYCGTLEKLVYLDYVLDQFSSVPVRKMKPVIRNILRLSLYQIRFMNSVPVPVSIDEGVRLTRKRGFQNLTGFVNAVLRRVSAESDRLELPEYVKAFAPEWIWNLICRQYTRPVALDFFAAVQVSPAPVIFRPNLRKGTKEATFLALREEGCQVTELGISNACVLEQFDRLTTLKAFQDGLIIMQDIGSMMTTEIASEGMTNPQLVVDVCAAPGGKSLFLAEKFPQTRILSRDLTSAKTALIEANQKRLGITNLEPQVFDARKHDESLTRAADLVIADLPCSGLGVIRRKPDLLYRLKQEDLTELASLQRQILTTVQSYVKPGGILVYSTCTVNRGENQEQTAWFQEQFPFRLEREEQYLPGRDPGDGFYIARFRRQTRT